MSEDDAICEECGEETIVILEEGEDVEDHNCPNCGSQLSQNF